MFFISLPPHTRSRPRDCVAVNDAYHLRFPLARLKQSEHKRRGRRRFCFLLKLIASLALSQPPVLSGLALAPALTCPWFDGQVTRVFCLLLSDPPTGHTVLFVAESSQPPTLSRDISIRKPELVCNPIEGTSASFVSDEVIKLSSPTDDDNRPDAPSWHRLLFVFTSRLFFYINRQMNTEINSAICVLRFPSCRFLDPRISRVVKRGRLASKSFTSC